MHIALPLRRPIGALVSSLALSACLSNPSSEPSGASASERSPTPSVDASVDRDAAPPIDGTSVVASPTSRADASGAAWPRPGFVEGVADPNPTFPRVVYTDVAVAAPLPASFPAHPPECDVLHFLRARHVAGPREPSDADRILIAQPGIVEGASAFYNVAGNVVTRAFVEHGRFVEFWSVDRRPNCLEDVRGIALARSTGNPNEAIDYYYRGKSYQGHTFAGFLDPREDAAWLAEMGMAQTVNDWNEIITRGIPDLATRRTKVFLGGHSMGGFVTGVYAEWDFDGDPSTTDDAGYAQCAGFFGLDTIVTAESMFATSSSTDLRALLGNVPDDVVQKMRDGTFMRFLSIEGVIDPEIMHLLVGVGLAAHLAPTGPSDLIAYLPADQNVETAYRFYHSRNLAAFLAATPSLTTMRYTNQALLGLFTDDDAMPLSIVRASSGFFSGGPVADKNFPVSTDLAAALQQIPNLAVITALVGGKRLAIATDDGGLLRRAPLYGWTDYDAIVDAEVPLDSDGVPYTSRASEVTAVDDLARSVGAWPMNFIEAYFPFRLALDAMIGTEGRTHLGGDTARPVLDITAADGPHLGGTLLPTGSPIVPGYDHLDVLTAAPRQNDGMPEKVTTYLLDFLF